MMLSGAMKSTNVSKNEFSTKQRMISLRRNVQTEVPDMTCQSQLLLAPNVLMLALLHHHHNQLSAQSMSLN
jgi:hypothetical protein